MPTSTLPTLHLRCRYLHQLRLRWSPTPSTTFPATQSAVPDHTHQGHTIFITCPHTRWLARRTVHTTWSAQARGLYSMDHNTRTSTIYGAKSISFVYSRSRLFTETSICIEEVLLMPRWPSPPVSRPFKPPSSPSSALHPAFLRLLRSQKSICLQVQLLVEA